MTSINLELDLSEINELYYATAKNVDAMQERAHSIPCVYSDLMLQRARDIHSKVSKALLELANETNEQHSFIYKSKL